VQSVINHAIKWSIYLPTYLPTDLSIYLLAHQPTHRSTYLPTYGPTALVDLGCFFSLLIYTQSVGLLGLEIGQSQGRYLHTERHKHGIIAHRHPSL
jgi:hypothetical protein